MRQPTDLLIVVPSGLDGSPSESWSSEQFLELARQAITVTPERYLEEFDGDREYAVSLAEEVNELNYEWIGEHSRKCEILVKGLIRRSENITGTIGDYTLLKNDDPALDRLRFSSESPRLWTAYKAHPFDSSFYVPLARFHQFMLHDKKGEFVRLASALGAKRIEMLGGESDARSTSMKGGGRKMGVGGEVEMDSSKSTSESFALDFKNETKPRNKPKLPEDTRWLAGEPLWQAMAETRLAQWATEFRVKFEYTSDFGVNAEVAAGLRALSISIGGEYEAKQTVDYEYLVEFWPRDAYEDSTE